MAMTIKKERRVDMKKTKRFDHCFIVVVDVERTLRRVDGARQFCAKPKSWTLRP
jgi:hypothetical protein